LYVSDSSTDERATPRGVATIDTATLELRPFTPFGGRGGRFELTGMRDGRMFAFDPAGQVPRIVEIDPRTGAFKSEREVKGIPRGDAWAMAQHWGDLYLFSAATRGHTQVTRFKYDKAHTEVVLADLGFSVVGAGISTCAASSHEGPDPDERPPVK